MPFQYGPPYDEGNNNASTYTSFINGMLKSPNLNGVSMEFGHENRFDESKPLPFVCFYFTGGDAVPEQRYGNLDPTLYTWKLTDNLVFECWAQTANPSGLTAVQKSLADQDAVMQLAGNVLQALDYQRTNGLRYARGGQEAIKFRWAEIEKTSYARGIIFMTPIDIPITQSPPVLAEVDSTPITAQIVAEVTPLSDE